MPVMDSTYNLYLCPKIPFPLSASSFKLLNRNLRSIGKNSFMNITKPALANEVDIGEVIGRLRQVFICEHVVCHF